MDGGGQGVIDVAAHYGEEDEDDHDEHGYGGHV